MTSHFRETGFELPYSARFSFTAFPISRQDDSFLFFYHKSRHPLKLASETAHGYRSHVTTWGLDMGGKGWRMGVGGGGRTRGKRAKDLFVRSSYCS